MHFEELDIDERFQNSETKSPFQNCLVCQKNVIEDGEHYFIERIFRRLPGTPAGEEVLFEYAMCQPCAETLRSELSKESLENIEAYFMERVSGTSPQAEPHSTATCLLTGKPIEEAQEYSYHAHCRGNKMIKSIFPYAISDQAMDEMGELLSQHTLDQLDDFKGNYFTGPPEFADWLNPKRLLPL